MNSLPLPNEIIRIIYQFVHPIFDYQKYIHALKKHEEEQECLVNIMNTRTNINTVHERIIYNDIISSYALLMNEYLLDIQSFLNKNPAFTRPPEITDLQIRHHKTTWEYEYDKNRIEYMEKNISNNRYMWSQTPPVNIMISHDIVFILKFGVIPDIEYACRINNISMNTINRIHKTDRKAYRKALIQKLMAI